ncbi:protein DMP3-like [Typha latifolia]|uniref:protein DMP3-like n=1 Tax=Typha latifolia TaxID=4733 RepID=UPI003C2E8752
MSLRPRSKPAATAAVGEESGDNITEALRVSPSPTLTQQALASAANLANLLPTGTLLAFQLLTPVFTANGTCDATTRLLTRGFLTLLASSCAVACFTDSCRLPDGRVLHGLATPRGMWLFDEYEGGGAAAPRPGDLAKYRIRLVDFVHAALSVLVFTAVAMRDKNVVGCFYPAPEKETREVLDVDCYRQHWISCRWG